ncbi:MAG: hypothetical protein AMJ45_04705 [Syntrophobacter sp. DG_60]|nr:MAG: hypothetical protein AMJ45_04705 [Syntrophobacter sp. DG_60]
MYFITFDGCLSFNSFSQGRVYLDINAKWPKRLILKKILGSKLRKWCQVNGEMAVCDANGWLRQKFKGVQIRNMEVSGNKITITI